MDVGASLSDAIERKRATLNFGQIFHCQIGGSVKTDPAALDTGFGIALHIRFINSSLFLEID